MKVLTIFVLLVALALPTFAQNDDFAETLPNDPTEYRPLGRFRIDGEIVQRSPDGYHIAEFTLRPIEREEVEEETEVVEEAAAEEVIEEMPVDMGVVDVDFQRYLGVWDIRGGDLVWQAPMPDSNYQAIDYSPLGDTIYVRSIRNTEDDDPTNDTPRITIFDAFTGEIIAQEDDVNLIREPLVPGEVTQNLSVQSGYATNSELWVQYSRTLANPRCGVWSVQGVELIWQPPDTCGTFNPAGEALAELEDRNPFSSYDQLVIYDVASGEEINATNDEVIGFAWLDDATIIIHRPYGDPPIIWDIADNTRAVMELPFLPQIFTPIDAYDEVYLTSFRETEDGPVEFVWVWDKNTGDLLREMDLNGVPLRQDGRMIILEQRVYVTVVENEDGEEFEEFEYTRAAVDFITGEDLWEIPWTHDELRISSDGRWGVAFNREASPRDTDFFDLVTGEIWATMPDLRFGFRSPPQLDWMIQEAAPYFTVWGNESDLDLFVNQPNGRIRYREVEFFENDEGEQIPRNYAAKNYANGEYVWAVARNRTNTRIGLQLPTGSIDWVESSWVALDMPLTDLPIWQ